MTKPRILKLTPLALAMLTALPVMAQTDSEQSAAEQEAGEIEEVVVTGSQIRGAAINDALSISVVDAQAIDDFGIESGDELLDAMPEQGQNFFSEAENIAGGVNSARGDIGAFNLRNIGTGNTLVLMNGRRVVNSATFQTEEVGGSFVPVNTANSSAIPVFGLNRVEVLRDGASAIYGADAVAGVVNTVMKDDYEGFSVRARYTSYDNIPRDDASVTIEWGDLFNEGRTAVGAFVYFYNRDRVNSQDDPKWADADYRRYIDEDSPWFGDTRFRNDSANSNWGQFDIVRSVSSMGLTDFDITDSAGEFETYPIGDPRCEGGFVINQWSCGHVDGQGTYRYNLNDNRDLVSDLQRFNSYFYLNHEFDNGVEAYTEFSWYEFETNLIRHPSTNLSAFDLYVGAENYWNPLGPCGSPNRLPDEIIGPDVPCEGLEMRLDNYRWAEVPRIVDHDGKTFRILQGFRGTFGSDWDWDGAVLYSKAKRDEVTRNRVSNTLMMEALYDPTPAAYNPWADDNPENTNIARALIDVYRNNETDLKLIDFKVSNPALFTIWGGHQVGFLAGAEYREESFEDDRDPRLDGTIQFTYRDGTTFPFVSDVVNSSPTADNSGSRDVTSLFTELAIPLLDTLDIQLALRYENFSDVGSTTVPKIAFGWRPTDWFMLRGSWSEAFRAPNLITVNESLVVRSNTNDDWLCQYAVDNSPLEIADDLDCSYNMQRRARGSSELEPEKSDNQSIGFVLTPIPSLTMTMDFWRIEKKDTIGLFGEENHLLLDLLTYLEANGSCDAGNPAVGRIAPDEDEIAVFESVGLCPVGRAEYVDDNYANLDTRIVEGFDFGLYYDLDTDIGAWGFTWQGSVYTKYQQKPGNAAQLLLDAQNSGVLPAGYPIRGFDDLLRRDGNQEMKMNARLNWRYDSWGAALSWFYLSDFYQSSLTLNDGTRWVIPSHSTFNAYVDYRFDVFDSRSRVRFGVRNLTDERAPLADRYFGYFSDAHSDLGRSYYLDVQMSW